MFPFQYGYAIPVFIGMILWTVIFILRKDLRKSMFWTGIPYGILALLTGYFWWTVDWWHPLTITGTRIGVEDFFTGFGAGGVMMTIYQFFYNKKIVAPERKPTKYLAMRIAMLVIVLAGIHILMYRFHFTSFESFSVVVSLAVIFIFSIRRDLIIPGLISGVLTTAVFLPIYWFTILTIPNWVAKTYDFHYLSGTLFIGIPIEELAFWLIAGSFVGSLSAFTWSGKFVSKEK